MSVCSVISVLRPEGAEEGDVGEGRGGAELRADPLAPPGADMAQMGLTVRRRDESQRKREKRSRGLHW
jgi:hypothetical protein